MKVRIIKTKYLSHMFSAVGLFAYIMSTIFSIGADNDYKGPIIFGILFHFFWVLLGISPLFSILGVVIAKNQIKKNGMQKAYKVGLVLNYIWTFGFIVLFIFLLFFMNH